MRGNVFGNVFNVTTFGESHGPAMGAVIDGCPAGVRWDETLLKNFLERRRPGTSVLVSARNESDQAELLSGVHEGKTLGTPIALIVRNQDARSKDYALEKMQTRRGHATDLWADKYGHSDPRGSGRASGRETVSRILGGAVARMLCQHLCPELSIFVYAENLGPVALDQIECLEAESELRGDPWQVDKFSLRMPSQKKNAAAEEILMQAKRTGESYGGIARVTLFNPPKNLGDPVFGKLKNCLAASMLSVGATTAFEFGDGFRAGSRPGTSFHESEQNYGGMRGGLSTGDTIRARVAFKPTSSVQVVAREGRHDPCIVPRAIPVLEAMAWLNIADLILLKRLDHI